MLLVLEAELLGGVGERRMEEKVFVICWEWGRKGKGDHGKFPATELGMRLGGGGLDLRSSRKCLCLPLAYLSLVPLV